MPLMNTQYDAIMRSYAQRQAVSRRKLEERLADIQRQIPELSSLESSLARKVRTAIEGNREELNRLSSELALLLARREDLLEEHGYSLEDLRPSYVCPDCQDTGYIGAEKCHCFLQAEINLLYHQSHLQDVLERENFHAFSYSW